MDYSKIESGRLEIVKETYMPVSVINDVINICLTRIGDKPVELVVDLPPHFPKELIGDSMRLRQCIINLTNNAIKFTNVGKVEIKFSFERYSSKEGLMTVHVIDTGIGIRKNDMKAIFESFGQVDSKRNRNVEGTGLGLAIVKNMISLMGGMLDVVSEYDVGSDFYFSIPQIISDPDPIIPPLSKEVNVVGLIPNPYAGDQLKLDVERIGGTFTRAAHLSDVLSIKKKIDCLFVQQEFVGEDIIDYVEKHPDTEVIFMPSFDDEMGYRAPNLRYIRRPVYSMGVSHVLMGEDDLLDIDAERTTEFDFIAPDCAMLIVDDNSVNLTVAEGIFRPLRMTIDTVGSGTAAIEKIESRKYDIILMDHMMPKMDGVECTHIIRRFHREYENIPIIALTANAVSGVKEMLISEGMTDFIAKPIEISEALHTIRKHLPKDKIRRIERYETETPAGTKETVEKHYLDIPGLDVKKAMKFMGGSEDTLRAAVKDYYRSIDKKTDAILLYEKEEKLREYTTEVHALKSASRQIGATQLSELAEKLENAGNVGNLDTIHRDTPYLIGVYKSYKDILHDFVHADDPIQPEKKEMLTDVSSYFVIILEAIDKLDMKTVEDAVSEMAMFETDRPDLFAKLEEAVDNMDTAACEEIIKEWIA